MKVGFLCLGILKALRNTIVFYAKSMELKITLTKNLNVPSYDIFSAHITEEDSFTYG